MSMHIFPEKYNSGDESQQTDTYPALAVVIDWFARLLVAPPEQAVIGLCRSAETTMFLTEIGEKLQQSDLCRRLLDTLTNESAHEVEYKLGYQYVMLFDGIAGPDSTPPYESFFANENGRLWQQPDTEMRKIMSALDVSAGWRNEPADHIALQLATLAEALRQKNGQCVHCLYERLTQWVPLLDVAIERAAPASFYSDLVSLLIAFLTFSYPHACMRD